MRAVRWHGRQDVRVEEVPTPTPGPGEALLRVSWCGICGTDAEEYCEGPVIIPTTQPNGLTGRTAPLTLGHEFAGTVAALGPGVDHLHVGDRVVPEVVLFCGQCFFCRHHQYALCSNWGALGLHADGGLAEYAVVPAFSCARVPDTLSDEAAALVEPTEVAVRAVGKARIRLGERVAVELGRDARALRAQSGRSPTKTPPRAQRHVTVACILRPHSLRSSSAPRTLAASRAASRDQVRGVGGPDPASQLLAPPAYRCAMQLSEPWCYRQYTGAARPRQRERNAS